VRAVRSKTIVSMWDDVNKRKLTEKPQDFGIFGYAFADMLPITLSNSLFMRLGIQVDMKTVAKVRLRVCVWSKVAPSGP